MKLLVVGGGGREHAIIRSLKKNPDVEVIYALPGNVGSKTSQLSNLLLKNGAKICTSADDVLGDFTKEYGKLINPFLLKEKLPVDMMSTLSEYGVCAVCPNDDIFEVPRIRRKADPAPVIETEDIEIIEPKAPPAELDSRALKIYKKIPIKGSCSIESLVDAEMNLRDVMKCLLKLEIGGFVRLLPGEMVSRKTN